MVAGTNHFRVLGRFLRRRCNVQSRGRCRCLSQLGSLWGCQRLFQVSSFTYMESGELSARWLTVHGGNQSPKQLGLVYGQPWRRVMEEGTWAGKVASDA